MASDAAAIGDQARAELADLIDRQMDPLGRAGIAALAPAPGDIVLDVGCGAGATLVQLAELTGPAGRVIGVDTGPLVLATAGRRTARLPSVTLLQQDAAALRLPDASLDGIFSRFGTMFFADPVSAFRNLRRMLRPGGRFAFVSWRSIGDNELDRFCIEASGLRTAVDPAPYRFEDAKVIRSTLAAAGFGAITVTGQDAEVSCGGAAETLAVVLRVGALGKLVRETPDLRSQVEPRLRAALQMRERYGAVHLGTATWVVTALA